MNKALFIFLLMFNFGAYAVEDPNRLLDDYDNIKNKIASTEVVSREVMARLYKINKRMKSISKKRGLLSDRMISAEVDVRVLAKATAVLEDKLKNQRRLLSQRLRTMYMLGDDHVVRGIFSATSSGDLEQTMRYLQLYAERDFDVINSYRRNLKVLGEKRNALNKKVKKLVSLRQQVEKQEGLLLKEQTSKSQVLSHLDQQKRQALKKLKTIRKKANGYDADLLNFTFFEQKGKLVNPTDAEVSRGYGLIQSEEFGYRLSHKGHFYEAAGAGLTIRSVFDGRVAYIGNLIGHGMTVILDHGDHYYTVYSGLKNLLLKKGDRVTANQVIDSQVSNLYFEIRHFSDPVDPKDWLKPKEG